MKVVWIVTVIVVITVTTAVIITVQKEVGLDNH